MTPASTGSPSSRGTSTASSASTARGGADIRRNHPAQRRIWGINGTAPTMMANQSEYYIVYEEVQDMRDEGAQPR